MNVLACINITSNFRLDIIFIYPTKNFIDNCKKSIF